MRNVLQSNMNSMCLILSGWVNNPKYKFYNRIFVIFPLFSVFLTVFILTFMRSMLSSTAFGQTTYIQSFILLQINRKYIMLKMKQISANNFIIFPKKRDYFKKHPTISNYNNCDLHTAKR